MNDIPKRYKSAVKFVDYDEKSMEDHINGLIKKLKEM